ncbi:hypothetical protein P879_03386 [Paragonimus westermani]|uniref:DNTTIP1 dimerisation domain-containing protein n=1 Tax=Paragonimus westermani TaxID=34504 RepID=A0A8T0DPX4_9TREM|nr:hypothetical protein P879_03386 [Paragonimus westermani]
MNVFLDTSHRNSRNRCISSKQPTTTNERFTQSVVPRNALQSDYLRSFSDVKIADVRPVPGDTSESNPVVFNPGFLNNTGSSKNVVSQPVVSTDLTACKFYNAFSKQSSFETLSDKPVSFCNDTNIIPQSFRRLRPSQLACDVRSLDAMQQRLTSVCPTLPGPVNTFGPLHPVTNTPLFYSSNTSCSNALCSSPVHLIVPHLESDIVCESDILTDLSQSQIRSPKTTHWAPASVQESPPPRSSASTPQSSSSSALTSSLNKHPGTDAFSCNTQSFEPSPVTVCSVSRKLSASSLKSSSKDQLVMATRSPDRIHIADRPCCHGCVSTQLPSSPRTERHVTPTSLSSFSVSSATNLSGVNTVTEGQSTMQFPVSPPPLPHLNLRHVNVLRYPKYTNRKNSGFERRLKHTGLILDPKLTLRLLRKMLQPFINQAVNSVMQHYMHEYIQIAVRNIRENLGEDSITEEDLVHFRRSIMQRVALQYFPKTSKDRCTHGTVNTEFGNNKTLTLLEMNKLKSVPTRLSKLQGKRLVGSGFSMRQRILPNCDVQHYTRTSNSDKNNTRDGDTDVEVSCATSSSPSSASVDPEHHPKPLCHPDPANPGFTFCAAVPSQSPTRENSPSCPSPPGTPSHNTRVDSISLTANPSLILSKLHCTEVEDRLSSSLPPHTPSPVASPCASSVSSCSTIGFFRELSSPEGSPRIESNGQNQHQLNFQSSPNMNSKVNVADEPYQPSDAKVHSTSGRRCRKTGKRPSRWWSWGYSRQPKRKRAGGLNFVVHRSRTRTSNNVIGTNGFHTTTSPKSQQEEHSPCNLEPRVAPQKINCYSDVCSTQPHPKDDLRSLSSDKNSSNSTVPHLLFGLDQLAVFTLGSSANTWLGMGAARGRIYTKHPELFRYACDAEDKAWLVHSGILTSHGVKAYLMHSGQVRQIARLYGRECDENAEGVTDRLLTFKVPPWLLYKMKASALGHPQYSGLLRSDNMVTTNGSDTDNPLPTPSSKESELSHSCDLSTSTRSSRPKSSLPSERGRNRANPNTCGNGLSAPTRPMVQTPLVTVPLDGRVSALNVVNTLASTNPKPSSTASTSPKRQFSIATGLLASSSSKPSVSASYAVKSSLPTDAFNSHSSPQNSATIRPSQSPKPPTLQRFDYF